ncbi:GNAT family N-acetyltransferase [Herpetosiphon giganteus]|uniref:GNAT family N-acetyltransferase n=1 Tax=Herpetosiphon giganteus TaxID=2029754 RepID=UPI0019582275|nr:GNAT family N-acetyltransferase [Herpetosiphon giganteus]MBM7845483.1 RimJ/RimL family protein N-acetyltransferase [Herpetosiphon giganteus]
MQFRFISIDFAVIKPIVVDYYVQLLTHVDSFFEDRLLHAAWYQIMLDQAAIGLAAVHDASMLVHFSLQTGYQQYGQIAFEQAKKLANVQAAFVPTNDQWLLSHALDQHRQLHKQAYFFQANDQALLEASPSEQLRLATEVDIGLITEHASDLFDQIPQRVAWQQLFCFSINDEIIGFGIIEPSSIYQQVASIGMHINLAYRQQGYGTRLIQVLIRHCQNQQLEPIAGCWYYNHNSKKTLERAGMYSSTRLLKIEF